MLCGGRGEGHSLGVEGELVSWILEPNSEKWQSFSRTSWHYPGSLLESPEEVVWTAGWRESNKEFMSVPQGLSTWQENHLIRTNQEAGGGLPTEGTTRTGNFSGHSGWPGPARSGHHPHPHHQTDQPDIMSGVLTRLFSVNPVGPNRLPVYAGPSPLRSQRAYKNRCQLQRRNSFDWEQFTF